MGKKQSPINISKDEYVLNKNLKPLIGDYYPVNANITNHVYNIGLFYDADAGSIEIDGTNYALKQMHWHSPSEHQIDGEQFPLELHLVHKTSDGKLAVVAILFRIGAPNPLLARLRRPLAMLAKGEVAQIPVGNLGAKHVRRITHRYYRYIGSLTTPPCSEEVVWTILAKVKTVTKDQVEALKAPLGFGYKNNSRPIQSLHKRKVELSHEIIY
ncbi:hypothetical protein ACFE04_019921 [Oxalis oulophora]